MDHILEKPPLMEAMPNQKIHGPGDGLVIRSPELEGIIGHERTHRPGVQAPVWRSRDPSLLLFLRYGRKAGLDILFKGPGLAHVERLPFRVVKAAGQTGGAVQPGQAPEIIPVIIIIGSQMLGAEPRWKEPGIGLAPEGFQALFLNPAHPFPERLQPIFRQVPAAEPLEAVKDPQHLAVGIPFPFLGLEIAVVFLATDKLSEQALRAIQASDGQQGVEHQTPVPEPESLIGVGSGDHVFG